MKRAPPPPSGHVDVRALLGICPVTREQAEANCRHGVHPMRPRRGVPGLVKLDARGLWRAIEAGTFPAPVRGPKGLEWPLDAVLRWKQSNHQ